MEKRKDHFSDWQLPSQTSFNKRGKKKALKGQPAASLRRSRDPGALTPVAGVGLDWCCSSQPPIPPGDRLLLLRRRTGALRGPWQRKGWRGDPQKRRREGGKPAGPSITARQALVEGKQ